MIEVLAALAIIGVIGAGGMWGVRRSIDVGKDARFDDFSATLERKLFEQKKFYGDNINLNHEALLKAGVLPGIACGRSPNCAVPKHPLSGALTIELEDSDMKVTYYALPKRSCIKVAESSARFRKEISVNGKTVPLRNNVSDLAEACAGRSNTLEVIL